MRKLTIIFLILSVLFRGDLFGGFQPLEVLKIEDFGAKSNDDILDTEAINKAIDSCSNVEGGVVLFSNGTYLSGSIHLKSDVVIQIDKGSKIQAAPIGANIFDSPEPNKWSKYQDVTQSHFHNAFIWGDSVRKVTIKGGGTISGSASLFGSSGNGKADKAISLRLCKDIVIEDINIDEGGRVGILATGCEIVRINNVKIKTQGDGINLIGTRDAEVENCDIKTVEYKEKMSIVRGDAIALKSDYSLGRKLHCKDIKISDCLISSCGNAIQIGPESISDFKNVHISNITVKVANDAGLIFTSNDGGIIDGVFVENVTMENVMIPIFINLSDRKSEIPGISSSSGMIKNVRINNFVAKDVYGNNKDIGITSTIMGKPGRPIDNMVLENMRITYKGRSLSSLGLTSDPAAIKVPVIDDYRPKEYGLRPSYGFYCRYVKGLRMKNVFVDVEEEDPRPAMILNNVKGAALDRFYAHRTALRDYDIILDNVSDFSMTASLGIVKIEKKDFTPLTDF